MAQKTLVIERIQRIEIPILVDELTQEETDILLGRNENVSIFDTEDILDWDNEIIVDEIYCLENNNHVIELNKPKII